MITAFAITLCGLFLIILIRYFIICFGFYWFFWLRLNSTYQPFQQQKPSVRLIRYEIYWSVISSAIFAVPGAIMLEAWKNGYGLIYSNLLDYPIWYAPLSLFVYLFLHDTYFYWTHRWMHQPKWFKFIHKVHHESTNPTPFAAFSFHYSESLVAAPFIPLLTFLIPIHIGVLLALLTLMTFAGVLNHCGHEIYPRWVMRIIEGHVITATHHDIHHKRYNCNYGLYFRFWDKWMQTDRFSNTRETS